MSAIPCRDERTIRTAAPSAVFTTAVMKTPLAQSCGLSA
jgi:hypothetical protein